jgi:hypothetical protein
MEYNYGVQLGMEAVPLIRNKQNVVTGIDHRAWRTMPFLCASQYTIQRDDFAASHHVPDGCEGVILCTGHTPDLTQENVNSWREMGWAVGSLARQHDDLVFN